MSKRYKLSAVLYGHSLDVRSVAVTPENAIISGSRDKTAKFWRPNEFNAGYVESATYCGQKNFVAAVLYLEPSEAYPDGIIITGGNDKMINIYETNKQLPTFVLSDHQDTVCCLSRGLDKTQFLSSSWDKTAKLWSITNTHQSLATFSGHEAALWSVIQIGNGNVVTASADKTISLWSREGRKIATLTGHTDCVRALCDFADLQRFASVSNDATIKIWSYTGENIDNIYGHGNYIYSISRNLGLGANSFVTSDEDYSVMCWSDGQLVDTIKLPAQSVWSVACLTNGDIVTGSSDGIVRIFTNDESRYASPSVLAAFDEEVAALRKQAGQEIGGYKVSDLPGKEALYECGKTAGQIIMIREGSSLVAYSWVEDADRGRWEKVGDVLGANEKQNEGKTLHKGQYYDFVFSVDVEDGKPPLKLPYNHGEDAYEAANKFITANFLPAVYLEQVVEFIRTNSRKEERLESATGVQYCDPFTGSSRYTPGASSSSLGSSSAVGMNCDPLTGGNSYNTSTTNAVQPTYFPHNKYLTFEIGIPAIILKKLKEFNANLSDETLKVNNQLLDDLLELCNGPCFKPLLIDNIFTLLNWPQNVLYPVIDIIRLASKYTENCSQIVAKDGDKLMKSLRSCIFQVDEPKNALISFRTLCNMFNCPLGEDLIHANRVELIENLSKSVVLDKHVEIGMMSFLLNFSILAIKKWDKACMRLLANEIPEAFHRCSQAEAHFRGLVALGNILTSQQPNSEFRNELVGCVTSNSAFLNKLPLLVSCNDTADEQMRTKRMNCAKQIAKLIKVRCD